MLTVLVCVMRVAEPDEIAGAGYKFIWTIVAPAPP
jgi:hypothetical protein